MVDSKQPRLMPTMSASMKNCERDVFCAGSKKSVAILTISSMSPLTKMARASWMR